MISDFPNLFAVYRHEASYQNKEEASQLIEFIAERVANIYAFALTAEGCQQNRNAHRFIFGPGCFPEKFPPQEKVEEFKNDLKAFIIRELSKNTQISRNKFFTH